jgi:hypothetical protein
VCCGGGGGEAYLGWGRNQKPLLKAIFKNRCISHRRKFHTRNNENTNKDLKTYPLRFPYWMVT